MTREHKLLIEPQDIVAIEIECRHCHSRVRYGVETIQPDRLKGRLQCLNCKEDLIRGESPEALPLVDFIDALRRLRGSELAANVKFELPSEAK